MTADVSFAIHMLDHAPSLEFAMNVTTAPTRVGVSSAAAKESAMPTIVRNVHYWKKIETVAQRLSTWAVRRLTCSMKEKNTVSRKGSGTPYWLDGRTMESGARRDVYAFTCVILAL